MKYGKKILSILLSVLLVFSTLAICGTVAVATGSGSPSDPYQISTYAELKEFANIVNGGQTDAWAILTADITATDTAWTPIANYDNNYTGTFDGQGHKINGLTFNDESQEFIGLFGYVDSSGKVQNTGLEGGILKGMDFVGSVAGWNKGTVSNCYNTGSIFGQHAAGGVVGMNFGTVRNCYNTGAVTGGYSVGGAVGENSRGSVSDCYNIGTVSGQWDYGSVIGLNDNGRASICYYDKDVCGDIGAVNREDTDGARGLTTAEMTGVNALLYLRGFSSEYWLTKENTNKVSFYPHLKGFAYDTTGSTEDWPAKIVDESYPDGSGTSSDPYQISNYAQLKTFAGIVNGGETGAYAVLTADIVCKNNPADTEYATDWTPIRNYFCTFDGQGHKIIGLSTPADYSEDYAGLFGYINYDGVVRNVGLGDGRITGKNYIGGVVGENYGTVENCYNKGIVCGRDEIAGVVGENYGTIENCFNAGDVFGNFAVGGVVGENYGTITNCYNTGAVFGYSNIGGIVGVIFSGTVQNCYNTGAVSGQQSYGGVIGYKGYGSVSRCYYDKDVCGDLGAINGADDDTNNVKGLSTAEMTGDDALTNLHGFSSDNWLTKANTRKASYYPHLKGFEYDTTGSTEDWPAKIVDESYPDGSGTSSDPYQISNYAQLKEFANIVNGGETGAYAVLTADIICKNNPDDIEYATDWTPIGFIDYYNIYPYIGTFDGQGHIIMGLSTPENNSCQVGLFGCVGEEGTVKNVGIEGGYISGFQSVGGVIGYNNGGTITNCYNSGTVSGNSYVGGVIGDNCGTVTNCYNTGAVSGEFDIGGVVGGSSYTIQTCYNTGNVSGNSEVSGITGLNLGTVTNCYNDGSISGSNNVVGGVAGRNYDIGTVENCNNTGDVTSNGNMVGGVVGFNEGTVSNCCNTGAVSGGNAVGGVIGHNQQSSAANCYNTGTVSGSENVGGVAGYNTGTVANCYNTGGVTASDACAGGVIGENSGTIENCYNSGKTSKSYPVGGLVGLLSQGTITNSYYDKDVCGDIGAVNDADDDTNNVKGLTTAQMTGLDALTNLTGFSYDNWLVKNNESSVYYYPHLKGFAYDTTGLDEDWPTKIIPIADYSSLDALIDTIPADLSVYTDETVTALGSVLDGIDRDLLIEDQDIVDGYVNAVSEAIAALYLEPTASISSDKIVRGQRATWTVVTPDDVVWLRFTNNYTTASGGKGKVITSCKYDKANTGSTEISVSDENGLRTWTVSMPFTYAGTAVSADEVFTVEYKRSGSNVWESFKVLGEDGVKVPYEKSILVAKTADIFTPATPNYDKYETVSVTADKDAGTMTVVTTDDVSKIRICYTDANTGKTKSTAYQSTSTSVISCERENGLTTWVVKYKFAPAADNTYTVQSRGPAWGEGKSINA